MGWFQGELSSQYQSELAVQKQSQVRSKCNLLLYVLPRNHLKRVNLLPDHTYCIPNVEGNHATLALRFLLSTITKSFSNIYQCKSEECGGKSESARELIIMRAISSTLFIIYEANWASWTTVFKQCVWAKGINIDTNIDKATWLRVHSVMSFQHVSVFLLLQNGSGKLPWVLFHEEYSGLEHGLHYPEFWQGTETLVSKQ